MKNEAKMKQMKKPHPTEAMEKKFIQRYEKKDIAKAAKHMKKHSS